MNQHTLSELLQELSIRSMSVNEIEKFLNPKDKWHLWFCRNKVWTQTHICELMTLLVKLRLVKSVTAYDLEDNSNLTVYLTSQFYKQSFSRDLAA